MNRSGRPKRKPSKEQVKVWLGTVVAPMVDALRVESGRVSHGNWSFRCDTQDFEFLWPTEEMFSPVYRPNAEQFWRYYPIFRKLAADHDDALAKLRSACLDAFERLLRSEDFSHLLAKVSVEQGDRKYLAEYVVNGISDLPSHYALLDVWCQHGSAFLDLRSRPNLKDSFQAIQRAGEPFGHELDRFLGEMERLQQMLADKFQLPPVDPVDIGTV